MSDAFEYLLRLGDDRLVLGHRTSEWCGHAPILEEDIALANVALDLVGQANLLLSAAATAATAAAAAAATTAATAATAENAGRDADALAFLRDGLDYKNVLMVELPNGDFAFTIARQFLFSAYSMVQAEALQQSKHPDLGGIAAKMFKETRYHVRHSGEWLLKLGDGTEESHRRLQDAINDLWRYTGELFLSDEVERRVAEQGIGVDSSTLQPAWSAQVADVLRRAGITTPDITWMQRGGRVGKHTEHLGHLLAEMQTLQRQHPGASW